MKYKKMFSYNFRLFLVLFAALLGLLPIIFIVSNSFMSAGEAAARYTSRITAYNLFGVTAGNMHYVDMTFLPGLISATAWLANFN